MKHIKRETRVVISKQGPNLGVADILDSSTNIGRPQKPPAKTERLTIAGRIGGFFKGEYAFLTASSDITLEQLYRKLMLAEEKDTRARTRFHEMMYVMASDLRAEKESPLAGLPVGVARSMNAWRERYNELDRYLGR